MPGFVIALLAGVAITVLTASVPVPLWLYRLGRNTRPRLREASTPELPAASHVRDIAGVIREAWIVRDATRRAVELTDECIALWPYVSWLAGGGSVSPFSFGGSENWGGTLLHRCDTQAADARLLVWQWVRRFDNAGEGHRAELERIGLDLEAARALVSGTTTITNEGSSVGLGETQTALAPLRRRRRHDLVRLRDQLQTVTRSIDHFEAALRTAPANPYR